MVTDVTEQRRLQEQLMVSDRMASIGTLAAGVAHEINNPLTAVLGNLQLASAGIEELRGRLGELAGLAELQEGLVDALEAAERVRHIVRDLRLFSRAEDDKRGPVDIERVIESSVRIAWPEIRCRARLVKNFTPLPPVSGNESRIGQVCLNLLVNAAQAIEEGHVDSNEISVSTRVVGDDVVLEIRDTGAGMRPEVLARLFTPFFTTKAVGVGTGLGLSICHRIISSMGGKITVDSVLGKGTLFRVSLPVALTSSVKTTVPPKPSLPPARRRGRILVVDDERMILNMVGRVLGWAHDVKTTTSAREAIAHVEAGKFDVIICDLMMPDMTGMDLYAELFRRDPELAGRIIFLTGGAFTPRARDFLDEVQNARLEKPFDHPALKALVNARVH
jgi:nitrogen-specific signal transduction histidine kinase